MYKQNGTRRLLVVLTLPTALSACDAISGRETAGVSGVTAVSNDLVVR